jgi:multiple sugar transport system ATP-binding protein
MGSPQMNFVDGALKKDGDDYYIEANNDHLYIDPAKVNAAMAAYVDKPVKMGVRPEDIHDEEAFLAANPKSVITTTVDVSELMGSEVYLYLDYQGARLTARVAPDTKSHSGDEVKVGVDTKKLHLFDPETEEAIMN